uniref:Uncharacterized protein n=1 Tax=Meloidogyne enterolobii TaxID=390850 RepID=A0A6V7UT78_MELEN|nr:unnamed protein product [Meloidogyne enterolobii]
MSSFFNRQPELFDTTKKFGAGTSSNGGGGNNTSTSSMKKGSGSNLAAAGLAMMAEKPLGPDEIDSVPGRILGRTSSKPCQPLLFNRGRQYWREFCWGGIISQRDSRLSPVSIQSPAVEFESSLEQVKYRLVKSMIGPDVGGNTNKSSTDWLWEWAYRSDGGASNDKSKNNLVINSTLTTPPNSPEPEETTDFFTFKSPGGKLYHRRIVSNKKLFDWSMFCRLDVLLAIVVSNLITGAVVYYCITRMENAQSASMDDPFAQTINKYFW